MKLALKKTVCVLLSLFMLLPLLTAEASGEMKASQACIDLIKDAEGFTRYKYWDYSQWTIGYGTGVSEDEYPDGITEEEAEKLLYSAVVKYEGYVNSFADRYGIELSQNQFDALVSLTYNMGNIWSAYDEFDLKNYLIDGADKHSFLEIAKGFGEWRKAGGSVLQGLVNRRADETVLFLSDRKDSSGEVWRVNSESGINLRREPDSSSEKTGFMSMNTIYYITDKKTTGDGSLWGRTVYEGEEHWCVLDYSSYMVGGPVGYSEENENSSVTGEKWVINSDDGVRLRSGPGLNYQGLGTIPDKAQITVTATAEADGYLWGKTTYSGREGWCALNFAEKADGQKSELPGRILTGIYISSEPDKTIYAEGEKLDLTGICVKAKYSDESEETVTDIKVDGFESVAGKHVVTVTYQNQTASFEVNVTEKKLSGIEIAQPPYKIVYKQGEQLDTSGMIVYAVYDNGSKEEISDYSVNGFDTTAGTKTIEVEYQSKKAYFMVEVSEKRLVDIAITRLPDKLEYIVGQELNTDGMIVCAYFDNNSKTVIESYSVSGYNPQTAGEQTITVGYSGIYKTFEITVEEPDLNELPGDLDGDGSRSIYDLVLLNQYVDNGKADFDMKYIYLADINGDGLVDRCDIDMLTMIVSQQ
ncbi:MAG: bacterial Ig-like domain-containing protein [Porcipelethomonas sp.]